MKSVRFNMLRLGRGRFLASYKGGLTLRLMAAVLIVRWSGYVPDFVDGWRRRIGRVEIHARRSPIGDVAK